MHAPKITDEHRWLQRLAGTWRGEGSATMGPGEAPLSWSVEETVRPIGDAWIQAESRGSMPDGDSSLMQITLGFDPDRRRFVGTFIGSMMTHLWVYDGELDASRRVLTLNAEGPLMTDESKMGKYQDVVEILSDDERLLSSRLLQPDGSTWTTFMTARYRRTR